MRIRGYISLLILAACAAPHRDYSVAQIRTVDNLTELMDVQATVADPCFALVSVLENSATTDANWSRFADMAVRLQATSTRVKEFSMGTDFDDWNSVVGRESAALVHHVSRRDQAGSLESIRAIKRACASCHRKYK